MRKRTSKLLSILIVIAVLITMAVPTFAAAPSDISGSWAAASITKWVDYGMFQGTPDGKFLPNDSSTRAQFAIVMARLFGYTEKSSATFADVAADAWYADAVSKAVAAGVFKGDGNGNFRPNATITRQEAFTVLARAFQIAANDGANLAAFSDAGQIPSWSKGNIGALVAAGYVTSSDGKINYLANITRAEFATMIDRMGNKLYNAAGSYTGDVAGNLVVNAPGVTLQNMTISGDLYLAEGIGTGDAVLENVTVNGRTIVKGGGVNSIIIRNSNLVGKMYAAKINGEVRILAAGSTVVPGVVLGAGAYLVEDANLTGAGFGTIEIIEIAEGAEITLDGDFGTVTVEAPGATVSVTETSNVGTINVAASAGNTTLNLTGTGTVGAITNNADGTSIVVGAAATITTLTTNAETGVTGTGTIVTALINTAGTSIETAPDSTTFAAGVTAEIEGETTGTSGTTPTQPPVYIDTTPYVNASNFTMTHSGGTVLAGTGTPGGYAVAIDLSALAPAAVIDSFAITTIPTTAALKITAITAPSNSKTGLDKTVTNLSNITAASLIGLSSPAAQAIFGADVTVGDLQGFFGAGSTVTVTGTLSATGYYSNNYTLTITLP